MSKTVACIIARTVSTRLPLKVLRNVCGEFSLLDFVITRLKKVEGIDEIYICTSDSPVDDILDDVASKNKVKIYRGSEDKVIERMLDVAELTQADNLIRITGDNVFTSYEYLDQQLKFVEKNNLEYCRVVGVPIGATAEIIRTSALKRCYESIDPAVSEYLLLFIFDPELYKCGVVRIGENDYSNITLTVDTPEDLNRTKKIVELFEGEPSEIRLKDILQIIETNGVANSYIEQKGEIKLPYGKTTSFADFNQDMNERIRNSINLSINE